MHVALGRAYFQARCPMQGRKFPGALQTGPALHWTHADDVSLQKKHGQKVCWTHRRVEINASTAMANASPARCRAAGKQKHMEGGKVGAHPLPWAPGFYQASSLPLLPAGELSQWPWQTAPELGNPSPQIVQTRSSGHWTISGIWHG